jgi:hypothetical protein
VCQRHSHTRYELAELLSAPNCYTNFAQSGCRAEIQCRDSNCRSESVKNTCMSSTIWTLHNCMIIHTSAGMRKITRTKLQSQNDVATAAWLSSGAHSASSVHGTEQLNSRRCAHLILLLATLTPGDSAKKEDSTVGLRQPAASPSDPRTTHRRPRRGWQDVVRVYGRGDARNHDNFGRGQCGNRRP